MEHNQTHDSTLAALGSISQTELDDLLSLDNTPLPHSWSVANTPVDDIMLQNGQQLPSQMEATQCLSPRALSNTQDPNITMPLSDCANIAAAPRGAVTTPITLSDTQSPQNAVKPTSTSLLHFSEGVIKAEVDLNISAASQVLDKTFAEDFSIVQADDFELPALDIDFKHLDAIEREHTTSGGVNQHIAKKLQAKPYTQIDSVKEPIVQHDTSASCPIPAEKSHRLEMITAASDTTSEQNNPLNFLALNYTKPTQSLIPISEMSKERCGEQDIQPIDFSRPESRRNDAQSELELSFLQAMQSQGEASAAPSNAYERAANPCFSPQANNCMADATNVPLSVKQLYDIVRKDHSDFAFVYALSAQLCQDRVPMDCFVSLKIGLLLSLASIGDSSDRPPIPIIALGSESNMTNYLMTKIAQFAERFVGPSDDFKLPRSSGLQQHKWIEADPVQLAMGGIYYVGDWTSLKVARSDKIFKDIERAQVTIENTSHVYPLQTAIWGHWCSYKHNAKDQLSFVKFVNIFGIPIYIDDDNHELLVDYLLEQSSTDIFESTVDHLSISYKDMKSFISIIAKRTVDITPDASDLLEKYFVAARVEHPDLTRQAFVTLKQFSESFAKLSFRHEVIPLDVIGAIYMCEHSMQNIFGASQHPPPKFESPNFVGEVDKQLAGFQEWLQEFIGKHFENNQNFDMTLT